MLKTSSK